MTGPNRTLIARRPGEPLDANLAVLPSRDPAKDQLLLGSAIYMLVVATEVVLCLRLMVSVRHGGDL